MPQRSNRSRSRSSNEPLMSHWAGTAKDHPLTTAAAAAGAAAAGVFLWSKRNQISDQISRLSDQIGEMRSGSSSHELALTEGPNESAAIESSRATMAGRRSSGSRSSGRTAKARKTTGRATPQRATM